MNIFSFGYYRVPREELPDKVDKNLRNKNRAKESSKFQEWIASVLGQTFFTAAVKSESINLQLCARSFHIKNDLQKTLIKELYIETITSVLTVIPEVPAPMSPLSTSIEDSIDDKD